MSGIIFRPAEIRSVMDDSIAIRTIGIDDVNSPRVIHRPHGSASILLLQLHSGGEMSGTAVGHDATIVWTPGEAQRFGNARARWTNSWIAFGGRDALAMLGQSSVPRNAPFSLRRPEVVRRFLLSVLDECRLHAHPDPQKVGNLLENLLIDIGRDIASVTARSTVPEPILRARYIVDTRFREPIQLNSLSRECNLSPNYLTSEFRHWFGVSLINYLIRVRLSHASDLLSTAGASVKAVATECGYSDPHYFSRAFKTHTGMSPRAYRDQMIRSTGSSLTQG